MPKFHTCLPDSGTLCQRQQHMGWAMKTQERTLPARGSCPTEAEMVVKGPMLSDSGTLPSPYSSYRYLMIASLSSSCLPEARRPHWLDNRLQCPLQFVSV